MRDSCRAPTIGYVAASGSWHVVQACCNSWKCPRCATTRAKAEYGRMVHGARELAENGLNLWFLTLTCRGKELPLAESEKSYIKWCNRLLTALRTDASRNGKNWHYALVTERQKRGHPHSHMLTTYEPREVAEGQKDNWKMVGGKLTNAPVDCLRSNWLEQRCVSAGLGNQYDISRVASHEAASRYIAKYLFKSSSLGVDWPKGWKRIRYSQSWPKLPDYGAENEAVRLMDTSDWHAFAQRTSFAIAEDENSLNEARHYAGNAIMVRLRQMPSN